MNRLKGESRFRGTPGGHGGITSHWSRRRYAARLNSVVIRTPPRDPKGKQVPHGLVAELPAWRLPCERLGAAHWMVGHPVTQVIYTVETYVWYVPNVSVRVDDEVLDEARRYSINVSEALRRGLAEEVRKAKVAENVKRLARLAQKPTMPAVEQLRGLRDGRRT